MFVRDILGDLHRLIAAGCPQFLDDSVDVIGGQPKELGERPQGLGRALKLFGDEVELESPTG